MEQSLAPMMNPLIEPTTIQKGIFYVRCMITIVNIFFNFPIDVMLLLTFILNIVGEISIHLDSHGYSTKNHG